MIIIIIIIIIIHTCTHNLKNTKKPNKHLHAFAIIQSSFNKV